MSSVNKSSSSFKKSSSTSKSMSRPKTTANVRVNVVTPADLILGGIIAGGITGLVCKHHERKMKRYFDREFDRLGNNARYYNVHVDR